jgi:EAL domain-containing protein (putative c-di-GMP-specific phosphodiesterase class I)/GGDEF domain-containing protein
VTPKRQLTLVQPVPIGPAESLDFLTGPAGRARFLERVGDVLALLPDDRTLAVVALDLNHFNEFTLARGDGCRDRVLAEVGDRLREVTPENAIALRAEDHFVVACELTDSPAARLDLQARVTGCFEQPFLAATPPVFLSASVGVAFSTGADEDPQQLLGSAEVGRGRARQDGDHAVVVCHPPDRVQIREWFGVHQALHHALERHELSLDYQPIVELASGRTTGLEALLRWRPHGQDLVPPDIFIPWAEESGLIIPIGSWVLREVVRQWADWRPANPSTPPPSLTVNVSTVQLEKGIISLSDDLREASAALTGGLSIEITESRLASDPEGATAAIIRLKRLGVGVIIDDFGTGYSSLRYLRVFPVDALKIDRSFIEHIDENDRDQAIVGTIIELAHSLGIITIAEGVETEGQLKSLAALSCDRAQGYLLSRPTPLDRARHDIDHPAGSASELANS